MKKTFEMPEVEIMEFAMEDVITTSTDGPDVGGGGLPILPGTGS